MLSFASAVLRRLTFGANACVTVGVALMCFLPSAAVAAQNVRVAGVVRDASGAFIAGAHVELHANSFVASSITDAAGAFAFDNVPETSGTLDVTAKGFRPASAPWTSSAGSPAQVNITLSA
ncbi:MAG: carboxypeptidase-like regulatory domain-containing protein, partial [Candidatus Acidiferrales bacterium]